MQPCGGGQEAALVTSELQHQQRAVSTHRLQGELLSGLQILLLQGAAPVHWQGLREGERGNPAKGSQVWGGRSIHPQLWQRGNWPPRFICT